jgi:hypothetical protein
VLSALHAAIDNIISTHIMSAIILTVPLFMFFFITAILQGKPKINIKKQRYK